MRPGLSSSSDDQLPGSLRQRQTRSPLRLAESRLDLLIAKRQEQGSSMLEEGKQDKNMDQIIQVSHGIYMYVCIYKAGLFISQLDHQAAKVLFPIIHQPKR